MKRFYLYLNLLSVLALMLFSSCSDKTSSAKLVPADAPFVMSIDVNKSIEAAGLNDETLKNKLTSLIGLVNMPENITSKFKSIINDPSETGINISQPVYMAITKFDNRFEPERAIITGEISDAEKFEDLIKLIPDLSINSLSSNDEIKYATVDRNSLLGFDSKNFVFTELDRNSSVTQQISELFNVSNSFADTKSCKNLADKDAVISLYLNAKPYVTNEEFKREIMRINNSPEIPMLFKMCENSELIFAFDVEKGKVSFESEFYPNSEEAEKYLEGTFPLSKPNGNFIEFIPENTVFAAATKLNGRKNINTIINLLKEYRIVGNNDGLLNSFTQIFSNINGDITINFDGNTLGDDNGFPQFNLYIESDDNQIVKIISGLVSDQFKPTKDNQWRFSFSPIYGDSNPGNFLFGYNDEFKASYFSINNGQDNTFNKPSESIDSDEFKDNVFYAFFNFKSFSSSELADLMRQNMRSSDFLTFNNILSQLDYAELKGEDIFKMELNVYFKDKDRTPVQVLMSSLIPFF